MYYFAEQGKLKDFFGQVVQSQMAFEHCQDNRGGEKEGHGHEEIFGFSDKGEDGVASEGQEPVVEGACEREGVREDDRDVVVFEAEE